MSLFDKIGKIFLDKSENKEEQSVEQMDISSVEERKDEQPSSPIPSPKQEPKREQPATPKKQAVKGSDESKQNERPIESMEELIRSVRDTIDILFENGGSYTDKRLVIWLDTDELSFKNTYNTETNSKRMMSMLVNELDVRFSAVVFTLGAPAKELRLTPVGKSGKVFMQVLDSEPEKPKASKKAAISIFGNAGRLMKEEYLLSSDEMRTKRIAAYNIGAGEFPQVPTGYRENHIAIDDNPTGPMIEKNKYVSRMHAHIGYSETYGFYLQVERNGTRLMGKRTRIFRGEEKIEMDNPQVKEPLQDGDLIELGKAVVLRFTTINN